MHVDQGKEEGDDDEAIYCYRDGAIGEREMLIWHRVCWNERMLLVIGCRLLFVNLIIVSMS